MKKKRTCFDVINTIFMVIMLICCIYPFYCLLVSSVSDPKQTEGWFLIFPTNISLNSYKEIIGNSKILLPVFISAFRAVAGTVITLVCCSLFAYLVTQKELPFRKGIYKYVVVTMYLNAGMIPWVITMVSYGLKNNIWVYIIPTAISAYYIILIKTYFENIPAELEESARIDGAGFFITFFKIILPVSAPILGAVAMFSIVAQWNSWYDNLMLVQDNNLKTLQLTLYQIIQNMKVVMNDPKTAGTAMLLNRPSILSVRSAIAMLTVIPILAVYPFMQKYFTSGIMVGAVKG
ncbi:carbohydrate ABC transporter permease [Robinsoniella peoriensis]|uniref:carbohydrate ABC transporter permease n=1 Tax=Robinsoniella peoriensis TaxID=180332 RepID=UPI0009F30E05|nr:carbohydrate ABC transporter permease [Robinsoniella peoriensis]